MSTTTGQTAPHPPNAATPPSASVVQVEDLVAEYAGRRILDRLNLHVSQGEILVIMGGSGSGKTTLLRHLLGLKRPSSGRVSVLGVDISRGERSKLYQVRKQIGVAFQGGALFGSLSLIENVELPLREHTNLDNNTIGIMSRMKLELMDLAGFEHLMPSELSGGMVKRAALARAVVMDPKLLFFDEPSAGLDPVVAVELDDLILKLREAMGITVVVVTHELQSAFKIADRIAILDKGQIVVEGTVDEVRNSDNRRVQDLLNRRARDEVLDPDAYLDRLTRNVRH